MPLIIPILEEESPAVADFGFSFVVDVLPAAIATPSDTERLRARLRVDDDEVAINSYTYREPRGSLGATLSITLAEPLPALVSNDSVFTFEVGVWTGEDYVWTARMAEGKLAGREYKIGFQPGKPAGSPDDTLSFSALNPLADKWQRAPRTPLTLFDGRRIDLSAAADAQNALRDEEGAPILPEMLNIPGLSLSDVLNAAYVTGCGFAEVRTNIPDFPVVRSDFTLQAGFHAGAAPFLAMFAPVYFADSSNVLWILDTSSALPAGLTPAGLTASLYSELTDSQGAPARTNALVLTYSVDADETDIPEDFLEQETIESGTFGAPGYTETTRSRKGKRYHKASAYEVITRETVEELKTEVHDDEGVLIHRETQSDRFDNLQRKAGHFRSVESRVPQLPGGELLLQTTLEEQCTISYRPHPTRPDESLEDLVITTQRGLIHVDNDNTYRDEPFRLPFVDAHRNGFVDAEGDQQSEFGPIRTKIERLDVKPNGQLDVLVTVVDEIANTTEHSTSTPRTGDASVQGRSGPRRSILLTILDTESDGRIVPAFDAGDLPSSLAIDAGRKHLRRLNDPPKALVMNLARVDFSLRRGSLRRCTGRGGALLGNYIITGLTETGNRAGEGFFIKQSVEGDEVKE